MVFSSLHHSYFKTSHVWLGYKECLMQHHFCFPKMLSKVGIRFSWHFTLLWNAFKWRRQFRGYKSSSHILKLRDHFNETMQNKTELTCHSLKNVSAWSVMLLKTFSKFEKWNNKACFKWTAKKDTRTNVWCTTNLVIECR